MADKNQGICIKHCINVHSHPFESSTSDWSLHYSERSKADFPLQFRKGIPPNTDFGRWC